MPPKSKFSKDNIINTAFEIASEEGFSKVTARRVAERLNSSVAPIYVNFKTIDDLITAVAVKVSLISEQMLSEQEGENLFEKIGRASIAFAQKYPVLLREMVIEPNSFMPKYETVQNSIITALSEDEMMSGIPIESLKKLILKMQIFQTGLIVMIANGNMPSWLDEKGAEEILMETGAELLEITKGTRKEK